MKPLAFSSDCLSIFSTTLKGELALDRPSIVINVSARPVKVLADGSPIKERESRLLSKISVSGDGATIVVVQTDGDDFLHMSAATHRYIGATWGYANPLAVDTDRQAQHAVHKSNTLKSIKDTVNGYQLFFCYQTAGVPGRIHRFHELFEVHTQILGQGMMQKYAQETLESAYETAHMVPGYTHYPFYNSRKKYPWHTYIATTNSVWLAIVAYD